jgi:hypothetical protein
MSTGLNNTDEPEGWRTRSTVTVSEYGKIMRVSRNKAYESVRAGEVATVKIGGCIRVCVPALLRQLEGR